MMLSSRHRRHIGAARRARAHDDGDLRDALRRHLRLIVEDAPEMPFVGKDLVLLRQERAAGVDHVDARQPVLARDVLRAQMLLHRQRIVGAALDGRVVGDDHALAPRNAADAGDDAGRMHVAAIEAEGGQRRKFEERGARIDQQVDALARQHLAARGVPACARSRRRRRTRPEAFACRSATSARIAAAFWAKRFRAAVDFGMKDGHGSDGNVIWPDCNRPKVDSLSGAMRSTCVQRSMRPGFAAA